MNVKLNEGLLIQKVVDEIVILEPESGDYYTLNETGAIMLENLQQGKTVAEISAVMSAEFNVDTQAIEQDLSELLNELEKSGLAQKTND